MNLLRVILTLLGCGAAGYLLFWQGFHNPVMSGIGALAGVGVAVIVGSTALRLRKMPSRTLFGGSLGLFSGILTAYFILSAVPARLASSPLSTFAVVFIGLGLGYLGLVSGAKIGEEFSVRELFSPFVHKSSEEENHKILDTSVIIDGRIADISETGFMEGIFLIPQFVLRELQHIADSPDTLKRNRGRRGLDILQRIQKKTDINVRISEQDFPKIREVDAKLIALARKLKGKIITNDFNLNKVAELQGVPVLNINQLANALKPVVLPGELMKVYILREGKELNQGVAYLDDGTMVVVDNAKRFIGKHVEVLVTSVLQTTAGRMIFTQLKDNGTREAPFSGTPLREAGG